MAKDSARLHRTGVALERVFSRALRGFPGWAALVAVFCFLLCAIPAASLAVVPILQFKDWTTSSGIATNNAQSLGIGDVNKDGNLDLLVTDYATTSHLCINTGGLRFFDNSERYSLQLTNMGAPSNAIFWDFNNDSGPDIYIPRSSNDLHLVFKQNVRSYYQEATGSGLAGDSYTNSAIPFDLDRDGYLDLFVGQGRFNISSRPLIMRNDGYGNFTDVCAAVGVTGGNAWGYGGGAVFTDLDLDGWDDMVIAHYGGVRIYMSNRDGTFRELAGMLDFSKYTNGADAGDYDNDGDIDLLISGNGVCRLYRNNYFEAGGDFTMTDISSYVSIGTTQLNGGDAAFGDLDNDGDLDFYIASYRDAGYTGEDKAYLNLGQSSFREQIGLMGLWDTNHIAGGLCSWVDLDNDGKQDLVISGGSFGIMKNVSQNIGHWLDINLKGVVSNGLGIGAKIWLQSKGASSLPKLLRECRSAKPRGSQCSPRVHFGLGDFTGAVVATVQWPNGRREFFNVSSVDKIVTLTELTGTPLSARNWAEYR